MQNRNHDVNILSLPVCMSLFVEYGICWNIHSPYCFIWILLN